MDFRLPAHASEPLRDFRRQMQFELEISLDDSVCRQHFQISLRQTQFATKDFMIVLAHKRRGRRRSPLTIHHKGTPRLLERSEHRMGDSAKEPARQDVRVLHEIRRRVDRQARNAVLLHQLGQIFFEKARCERSHLRIDVVRMSAPQVAVDPFRIVELGRMIFPDFEQKRPVSLGDEKRDLAILAFKQIRRRIVLVLAAGTLHHPALGGIVEGHMFVQRHTGLNRCINVCADAAGLPLPESQASCRRRRIGWHSNRTAFPADCRVSSSGRR